MNELSVFSFQDNLPVRVVMVDGDPWFVAKDICDALGLANSRKSLSSLDDDEKGVTLGYTLGGEQKLSTVSESGLYTLILRCRDAVKQGTTAWRFRKWVTNEVLPAIRKNGEYTYIETAPKCAAEPLDARTENELRGIVALIAECFRYREAWIRGIRQALRNACRTPAPNPLTVDDLPAIIAELRRIMVAVEAALGNMKAYERDFLRDVIRKGHKNIPAMDLPAIDFDMEQERVLPAHYELAIQKLETLAAKINTPCCLR